MIDMLCNSRLPHKLYYGMCTYLHSTYSVFSNTHVDMTGVVSQIEPIMWMPTHICTSIQQLTLCCAFTLFPSCFLFLSSTYTLFPPVVQLPYCVWTCCSYPVAAVGSVCDRYSLFLFRLQWLMGTRDVASRPIHHSAPLRAAGVSRPHPSFQ